jgi:hypothetical protein
MVGAASFENKLHLPQATRDCLTQVNGSSSTRKEGADGLVAEANLNRDESICAGPGPWLRNAFVQRFFISFSISSSIAVILENNERKR